MLLAMSQEYFTTISHSSASCREDGVDSILFFICFFCEIVSLGWLQTHCVAKTGLLILLSQLPGRV